MKENQKRQHEQQAAKGFYYHDDDEQDKCESFLLFAKRTAANATAGGAGRAASADGGDADGAVAAEKAAFRKQLASENDDENNLYKLILENKIALDRIKIAKQDEVIKTLTKLNQKQCDKKDLAIAQLRHINDMKQQKTRRMKHSLKSIKEKVKNYMTGGNNIGIDIVSWTEAQKWAAMFELAKERIQKETDGMRDMTVEDREEMKITLTELFEHAHKNLGKFNKSGDKRGIHTKIPPRVLAAAQQISAAMSSTSYEKARLLNRNLPAYSTIKKYSAQVG